MEQVAALTAAADTLGNLLQNHHQVSLRMFLLFLCCAATLWPFAFLDSCWGPSARPLLVHMLCELMHCVLTALCCLAALLPRGCLPVAAGLPSQRATAEGCWLRSAAASADCACTAGGAQSRA
jgi:hypothetical protein